MRCPHLFFIGLPKMAAELVYAVIFFILRITLWIWQLLQ